MVGEDINFMDLACLLKITPDTVLERFGSSINASFFDASNIAGTLKQKGLIDFSANYPGPNNMIVTEIGKKLITDANAKTSEAFDSLDQELLKQLSGGKRVPKELEVALNVRARDLAMHIYKLYTQKLLIFELRNGTADILLTEEGFLKVKAPEAKSTVALATTSNQVAPNNQGGQQNTTANPAMKKMEDVVNAEPKKGMNKNMFAAAIFILIIILALMYYQKLL